MNEVNIIRVSFGLLACEALTPKGAKINEARIIGSTTGNMMYPNCHGWIIKLGFCARLKIPTVNAKKGITPLEIELAFLNG